MREAFTYMFKDNCFGKKVLMYLTISFIASLFISYSQINTCAGMCPIASKPTVNPVDSITPIVFQIIGILINMIIVGYFFTAIKAISSQSNNIILPFFSIKNNFVKGFKFNLVMFATIIIYSFAFGLLQSFYNTYIFAKISLGILLLFYTISGSAFVWFFAQEEKFTTFFNFKKVLTLISRNVKKYIKFSLIIIGILLLSIALSFTIELIIANLTNSIILAMIISTLVITIFATYINFVTMYLIAKSIKESVV